MPPAFIDQTPTDGSSFKPGYTPPASSTSSTATPTDPKAPVVDDFTKKIQERLLGQAGIISSESSGLEGKIQEAINGIRSSNESSAAAITSKYDREISVAREQGQTRIQSAMEAQRGYAQNTAALKQLNDDTDKQLKDMEQRKQELILQGNAAAAGKISEMQIQTIQFRMQAQQQAFSNLLGIGQFGLQAEGQRQEQARFNSQMAMQERQQDFQETQAINNIALQFGLKVEPGDTIDSITSRAAPFASEKQKLEFDKARADIARSKAETQRAIAETQAKAREGQSLSAVDLSSLGALYDKGAYDISTVKDIKTAAAIAKAGAEHNAKTAVNVIKEQKAAGVSKQTLREQIQSSANIKDKAAALEQLENLYGPDPVKEKVTFPGLVRKGGSFAESTASGLFEFFTGRQAPSFDVRSLTSPGKF